MKGGTGTNVIASQKGSEIDNVYTAKLSSVTEVTDDICSVITR